MMILMDITAEAMGFGETVPAFLDRTLKPIDLLHGVSFASASSGYDDLTANLSVNKTKTPSFLCS